MTCAQVAAYLGLSSDTVYQLRASGKLPAVPHGNRSWRWQRETVLAYDRPAAVTSSRDSVRDVVRSEMASVLREWAASLDQGGVCAEAEYDTYSAPTSAFNGRSNRSA